MRPRRFVALATVVALAFGGVACSKNDSTTESSATTVATNPAASGTGATNQTASGTGTTDSTASGTGTSAGTCPTQEEVDKLNTDMSALMDNPRAESDPAGAVQRALAVEGKYIPESLQADWATVSAAATEFVTAMAKLDPTDTSPENIAALTAAGAPMRSPEMAAAQQRINDYFRTTCPNINFGDQSSSGGGN